ncbi:MAG TPA: hypothetical protein VM409_07615, partial [Chloroflexia bacterium]|nr:hypothetical protein [Chloroflexia bacterium]
MSSTWLPAGAPLVAALVACVLWFVSSRRGSKDPLRELLQVVALAVSALGLVAPLFLAWAIPAARGGVLPAHDGVLLCVQAALISALFLQWSAQSSLGARLRIMLACLLTSAFLVLALGTNDRTHISLLLLAAALAACGPVLVTPPLGSDDADQETSSARSITGGVKHISSATLGTCLLVIGALLVARYAVNLENSGLQQLGAGLVVVGLVARAGVWPFAPASSDLLAAAAGPAVLVMGAVTPSVIAAGIVILDLQGGASPLRGYSLAWLPAIGVLLAGLRALGAGADRHAISAQSGLPIPRSFSSPDLFAATIALQAGWAMFGVLSGSTEGVGGALLLAANTAIAVPLLVAATGSSKPALAVAAASLLGLPPTGGFVGTLLVARSAAAVG